MIEGSPEWWKEFHWIWEEPIVSYVTERQDDLIYITDVLNHFAPTSPFRMYMKNKHLREHLHTLLWAMLGGPKHIHNNQQSLTLGIKLNLEIYHDEQ